MDQDIGNWVPPHRKRNQGWSRTLRRNSNTRQGGYLQRLWLRRRDGRKRNLLSKDETSRTDPTVSPDARKEDLNLSQWHYQVMQKLLRKSHQETVQGGKGPVDCICAWLHGCQRRPGSRILRQMVGHNRQGVPQLFWQSRERDEDQQLEHSQQRQAGPSQQLQTNQRTGTNSSQQPQIQRQANRTTGFPQQSRDPRIQKNQIRQQIHNKSPVTNRDNSYDRQIEMSKLLSAGLTLTDAKKYIDNMEE